MRSSSLVWTRWRLKNWRITDGQLESPANIRGCAPGNRDVCGGEVWFERWELEDTLIQLMLMQSIILHQATGWLCAVELIFRETAMFTSPPAKAMARKINRARRGPRVLAKERARKVRETENPKFQKCQRFVQG